MSLVQLQRESGHSKHTTFHSSSEGEEKGQQRACTKKEVGGESCEEKEQKGGGYCSVHYNDRPLAVFCAKHRHGRPVIVLR